MRLNHIVTRLEQQLTFIDLISHAAENLERVGQANITSQRIHARLASLKETWEQFLLQHQAVNLAISELDTADKETALAHSYFSGNSFSSTHECYLEAIERMSSFLESEREPSTHSSLTQSNSQGTSNATYFHHARLPRIDIPKFNGTPADWLSFKDLFSSLVLLNPTLTSVEKLQYLKTSLIGSAALLLKNTTLTADNFQKAWDALISFYENKRLLVNAALHSLVSLKRMSKESAGEMEQLYTNIMQIYRTLETLDRPVQHWDDVLVFTAVQRLDSESVKAWEHHLGSSKDPPTWDQFSTFLISRLLSLQAFEKSRPGKSANSANQASAKSHFQGRSKDSKAAKVNTCTICSSKHYIAQCPQYGSKTVPQRLAIITKHKLCYNCLGPHRSSVCRVTKRCLKCGHKHHTSIHQANKQSSNSGSKSTEDDSSVASTSSSTATEATVFHSASK
ncbi:PREDICTED: uncharacterized protein LOC105556623 [Vollenhovia emeryi]|uniref:uncharacterized protein LOC105556623 n=1 Tax=Vollenhovia emeryi TaxID=411798 RepID=UPI0005F4A39E|nr:PREDICTED: uncharacterized protein LOC105556623 [Vollenhovia emeryi]